MSYAGVLPNLYLPGTGAGITAGSAPQRLPTK